jgi:hypothetical protein
MKSIFESDVFEAEKRLKRAKTWDIFLKIFTLGSSNNKENIFNAQEYLTKCKSQHEKYQKLMEKAKYIDDQLLQTVVIEGIRISKNTFSDFPVLGAEGYPKNWELLRAMILTRDNYECNEKNASCSGPLQIHHILPLSKGGTNKENNLITLCMYHHCLKHEHMRERYANIWL